MSIKKRVFWTTSSQSLWCGTIYYKQNVYTVDQFYVLEIWSSLFWPSKEVIQKTMPADFKEKFPSTRIVIDCTEVFCEMPSSLLLNSELFSSYKNHVTLKGLVGISPSGAITFVSQLYTGSISDQEIVLRSGLLSPSIWWWGFSDGRQRFSKSRHFTPGCKFKHPTLSWRQQSDVSRGRGQNSTNCQCENSCGKGN